MYSDRKRFAMALLNQSSPILLAIGGNYTDTRELQVESVLPFAFLNGIGGPSGLRRTKISIEACFQRQF